jgi:hypothetical protein
MSNKNGLPLIGSPTEKTQDTALTQPLNFVVLTRAEYDALATKVATTVYLIVG